MSVDPFLQSFPVDQDAPADHERRETRLLDQLVFKGSLNLSQQAMRYIQIGFLFVCVSGMLNGLLNTVIGTVFNAVFNFFLSVLG